MPAKIADVPSTEKEWKVRRGPHANAIWPCVCPRISRPAVPPGAMRFVFKQKFWCLGDDFVIRDDEDRDCYLVDGRAFSFGEKLSFQDMQGNELAFIRQRLLSWGPTYDIERPGHEVITIKKELFTFFRCKFSVDGPGEQDYEASGDFLDHEYEIQGPNGPAAWISKKWFSWTDTYGVEIVEGEEPVLLLATAVVIDLVCHDRKQGG